MQKQERIWELDALRGLCILCVIVVHFLFDLVYFAGLDVSFPPVYVFIQQYGGVIFVVLSGCCATLGSRSFRRGAIVFGCGMLISAVTAGMYFLGMAARDVIVWFGVLHLLGVCMMLYPVYKKLPTEALACIGVVLVVAGYLLAGTTVEAKFLFPLGLCYPGFASSDYFPLLPHLGWYMLGTVFGRTVYADKKTRLPGKAKSWAVTRFFCFCGRQSLWIYLIHQPVVFGLLQLVLLIIE
ncbi:MAG: heparan-alpha-glucosaminide N-acetyltransferase [Oscillospiraceae bacterium]